MNFRFGTAAKFSTIARLFQLNILYQKLTVVRSLTEVLFSRCDMQREDYKKSAVEYTW